MADLADIWRSDGLEVIDVFGTRRWVPADVAILHVNMSVVPHEYLEAASRYPVALNGSVKDIRKSTHSRHLVAHDNGYDGPVIVKTDLNTGGRPERRLQHGALRRRYAALVSRARLGAARQPLGYQVFGRAADVPTRYFTDDAFVVERFLPEMEGGLYHVRNYHFLGDSEHCFRLASPNPVIRGRTSVSRTSIDPDPGIVARREELDLDYGKLDYVVHDGEVVVFDVNKTTGLVGFAMTPELRAERRHRAAGIYRYLT
jgi:hypothetical protein